MDILHFSMKLSLIEKCGKKKGFKLISPTNHSVGNLLKIAIGIFVLRYKPRRKIPMGQRSSYKLVNRRGDEGSKMKHGDCSRCT
jgi:hypothetical protein